MKRRRSHTRKRSIESFVGFEFLDRRDEKVTHSSRKTFQYSYIETTTRQEEHWEELISWKCYNNEQTITHWFCSAFRPSTTSRRKPLSLNGSQPFLLLQQPPLLNGWSAVSSLGAHNGHKGPRRWSSQFPTPAIHSSIHVAQCESLRSRRVGSQLRWVAMTTVALRKNSIIGWKDQSSYSPFNCPIRCGGELNWLCRLDRLHWRN